MIRTGPRTQRARYSIRSSIPSSAQWMSSIAKTTGRSRPAASTSVLTAEKRRERTCWGSSESALSANRLRDLDAERAGEGRGQPVGRVFLALHAVVAQELLEAGAQAAEGDVGLVRVGDPELVADDLAERPVREPGAVRGAVPDPHER